MSESNARRTFQTAVVSVFAGIAIALALAGLYGLMSHVVKQRTAEIAVRMDLGAERQRIVGLVLYQALSVTGLGLLIGLCGAFALHI
jgi:putative ABC transport system permease protein